MSVNDEQVGGHHYKDRRLQPWDLDRYGVGGLEWTTIKYVSRYREKDGLLDLQKAEHYLQKIIEERRVHGRQNRVASLSISQEVSVDYADQWALPSTERAIVAVLLGWRDIEDLQTALGYVRELIAAYASVITKVDRDVRQWLSSGEDDGS